MLSDCSSCITITSYCNCDLEFNDTNTLLKNFIYLYNFYIRGGIKKRNFFFTFGQGGGRSRPIQKILIRKYSDFFLPFLTKNWVFLTIFFIKGGGVLPRKSLSGKTEVVKKGGGGASVFLLKVKKQFFY